MAQRTFRRVLNLLAGVAGVSVLGAGCGAADPEGEAVGQLAVAITGSGPSHDVTAVAFAVVDGASSCADEIIAAKTVGLESEGLPTSILPAGAGSAHAFSDGLFILPPGSYRVCAKPMAGATASLECAPTDSLVTVMPGATNEVVLLSQCHGDPSGALDAVVGLNDPPKIDDLVINPSKFITPCETAKVTMVAQDPNGDTLSYKGKILHAPAPSSGTFTISGNVGTFVPGQSGDYELEMTVSDGLGGHASLKFPIHVANTFEVVNLVGDKDDFHSGDAADSSPLPSAFQYAVEHMGAENPWVQLDDAGVNRPVAYTHNIPGLNAVPVHSASLHFKFDASECSENDYFYFSEPYTGAPQTLVLLKDLVGKDPIPGKVYEVTLDLAKVPTRSITVWPVQCGLWDDLGTKSERSLLGQVATGSLNMLFMDDTRVDFSELQVTTCEKP